MKTRSITAILSLLAFVVTAYCWVESYSRDYRLHGLPAKGRKIYVGAELPRGYIHWSEGSVSLHCHYLHDRSIFKYLPETKSRTWTISGATPTFAYLQGHQTSNKVAHVRFIVPFWLLAGLTFVPLLTTFLIPLTRKLARNHEGLCLGCGYDLTGNESGRCPECGEATRILAPDGRDACRQVS